MHGSWTGRVDCRQVAGVGALTSISFYRLGSRRKSAGIPACVECAPDALNRTADRAVRQRSDAGGGHPRVTTTCSVGTLVD